MASSGAAGTRSNGATGSAPAGHARPGDTQPGNSQPGNPQPGNAAPVSTLSVPTGAPATQPGPELPAARPDLGLSAARPDLGLPAARPDLGLPAARPDLGLPAAEAATLDASEVLGELGSSESGLTTAEAARRLARLGPNALRDHRARPWPVLARQFRSALLLMLLATAGLSFLLGERADALLIATILAASIGLGFFNEYRAERASEALHNQVRHNVLVVRDGVVSSIGVVDLVPGDLVHLSLGTVIPADLRLIRATELECDEAVLTGESLPVTKSAEPTPAGLAIGDQRSIAFMGTVVHAGSAAGVVVATGSGTEFGRIATALGQRQPETDFQVGLRQFSMLLLQVALVLTSLIFVTNLILQRSLIDSLLFSLAIAVGITPQLLPAVVSTGLAAGCRQLARRRVLVKRLVCIEDLGDLDVLVTDKTGTLTDGRISFVSALDPSGAPDDAVLR
ncbi:MAG TPA: HAD-IC family P-type ATPase, partial [Jatrophihabitans sp.]|nr:HAD-IC family P-type ATPase [Jatrophihabitans sp.]